MGLEINKEKQMMEENKVFIQQEILIYVNLKSLVKVLSVEWDKEE